MIGQPTEVRKMRGLQFRTGPRGLGRVAATSDLTPASGLGLPQTSKADHIQCLGDD